jgi:hypothetical protein
MLTIQDHTEQNNQSHLGVGTVKRSRRSSQLLKLFRLVVITTLNYVIVLGRVAKVVNNPECLINLHLTNHEHVSIQSNNHKQSMYVQQPVDIIWWSLQPALTNAAFCQCCRSSRYLHIRFTTSGSNVLHCTSCDASIASTLQNKT